MRLKQHILFFCLIGLNLYAHPGEVIRSFQLPFSVPTGLTFDGSSLWVADHRTDRLFALNPKTGKTVRSIPSPGFWPMGLAWDGQSLWNLDQKENKIYKIDPKDGSILTVLDAPSTRPEGLAWDGQTLWLTDSKKQKILKIDLSDGTAVQSFPSPGSYPEGLTWDGTYLWCTDRYADELHMIDAHSGEVIIVTKTPGPYPRGLTFDGESLWSVDYQTDRLYQIVREDEERYTLSNARKAMVTFTHEVKGRGKGLIQELNTYIAIPEAMPQQQILNVAFDPSDYQSRSDRWNQNIACFYYEALKPEDVVLSKMMVQTEISEINYFIFPDQVGTLGKIPAQIKDIYTANGSKYRTDTEFIQTLSAQIVKNETNPYWMARRIFDYVRETLEYKLEGGWNIAPVVLGRGTGSCSEYTFSFIALCRAAGIPARYVGALVVRGDDASLDDVFHRWPEVYLPNYGWIPMDPQGGDKESPRDRAMNIGHLSNRFLITTQGGGDSEYLGWYYNSYETVKADAQVKVNIETFGEWEPVDISIPENKSGVSELKCN